MSRFLMRLSSTAATPDAYDERKLSVIEYQS